MGGGGAAFLSVMLTEDGIRVGVYNTECYKMGTRLIVRGAVRGFKNKPFTRFANKVGITDAALRDAIANAERGLVDADLGGGVLKQRIARAGGGKSGGFRTIILFKVGDRAFFVHGFAKNEKANIRAEELAAFKMLAHQMLGYSESALDGAVRAGVLVEVTSDDEAISQ